MDRDGSFKIMGTVFNLGRKYVPIKGLGRGAYGVVWYVETTHTSVSRVRKLCSRRCVPAYGIRDAVGQCFPRQRQHTTDI